MHEIMIWGVAKIKSYFILKSEKKGAKDIPIYIPRLGANDPGFAFVSGRRTAEVWIYKRIYFAKSYYISTRFSYTSCLNTTLERKHLKIYRTKYGSCTLVYRSGDFQIA